MPWLEAVLLLELSKLAQYFHNFHSAWLILIDQIQDDNHEIRGSFVNKLGEVIPLLVHQMAHALVDTLVLFLDNRQQADDAMPMRETERE